MKAEDKNPLQRVRIAVLGNVNVGKSGKLFLWIILLFSLANSVNKLIEYCATQSINGLFFLRSCNSAVLDATLHRRVSFENGFAVPPDDFIRQWPTRCGNRRCINRHRQWFSHWTNPMGRLMSNCIQYYGPGEFCLRIKSIEQSQITTEWTICLLDCEQSWSRSFERGKWLLRLFLCIFSATLYFSTDFSIAAFHAFQNNFLEFLLVEAIRLRLAFYYLHASPITSCELPRVLRIS